ncbi:hypothetical protein [Neisseria sp. 19428wB4_WF04]|nr:hypothetical protein [Neisseria sp. 19428wB4_WF04]
MQEKENILIVVGHQVGQIDVENLSNLIKFVEIQFGFPTLDLA